jgi:methylamine dehydrogenase heavy chain
VIILRAGWLILVMATGAAFADGPLEPEPLKQYTALPEGHPDHWLLVHDLTWFRFLEGRVLLVDPLAKDVAGQFKGSMSSSLNGGYERSLARNEHYIAETFWSRGNRGGERTDVVAIYNRSTLEYQGEIIIPPKRLSGMPKNIGTAITPDERFMLIYNFTPSQSVSVVDVANRRFVGEADIAGCGFVIATGERSFFSLCSNGTLRVVHLDDAGQVRGAETMPAFFDADEDPLFESAALSPGRAVFPTFQGRMVEIDTRHETPRIMKPWWLTNGGERSWRPAGARPVVADASGLVYVLMQPDGAEGTHKNGGGEVWVVDPETSKRLHRITLKNWGIALGTTGKGEDRLMIVTNADLGLDVYRIPEGAFVQTLAVAAEAPLLTLPAN